MLGTGFCVPDWRRSLSRFTGNKLSDKSEQVSEDSEQVLRETMGFFRGLKPSTLNPQPYTFNHCHRISRTTLK